MIELKSADGGLAKLITGNRRGLRGHSYLEYLKDVRKGALTDAVSPPSSLMQENESQKKRRRRSAAHKIKTMAASNGLPDILTVELPASSASPACSVQLVADSNVQKPVKIVAESAALSKVFRELADESQRRPRNSVTLDGVPRPKKTKLSKLAARPGLLEARRPSGKTKYFGKEEDADDEEDVQARAEAWIAKSDTDGSQSGETCTDQNPDDVGREGSDAGSHNDSPLSKTSTATS